MPQYTFNCKKCGPFEVHYSIKNYKDYAPCPNCNLLSIERVYQIDLGSLEFSVKLADSELATLGHLASRNTEKFSKDYKQHLHKKHNAYRNKDNYPDLPSGMEYMKKRET